MATYSAKEVAKYRVLADSGRVDSACCSWVGAASEGRVDGGERAATEGVAPAGIRQTGTGAVPWRRKRAPGSKNVRLPPAPELGPAAPPQTAAPLDVGALLDSALLAAVLGCTEDRAADILARAGSLIRLARFGLDDLMEIARVSRADAKRIAAACELGRRSLVFESRPRGPLVGVAPLARWFRLHIGGMFVQEVWVAGLDDAGALRGVWRVSRGDVHGGMLDAAAVVRGAARMRFKHIILAHNHPSGSLVTTPEDLRFVLRIHRAALAAGIKLVDCLITGPTDGYTSLAEQGVLPGSS